MRGEIADMGFGERVAAMTQDVRSEHEGRESTDHTDVVLPTPRPAVESDAAHLRPFAHGSVDVVIPAPRSTATSGGGVAAPTRPARPVARTPSVLGRRTPLLVAVSVVAAVLLVSGLYAAAVARPGSPRVSSPVSTAVLADVTYSVTTAHGSAVVVDYSRADGGEYAAGSATDVPSPWQLGTRVNVSYGPSLSASIAAGGPDGAETDDTITCTIIENGRTVAQQTQSGPGASVSCLP